MAYHTDPILHGYRDSEEFSREEKLYRPNRKNHLNWGALQFGPQPPFSNITFLT